MSTQRQLAGLAVVAAAVALLTSLLASAPTDGDVAVALLSGCVAAATALAAGAGRPPLCAAAFAGLGGYVSGGLVSHGVLVPVAVPIAVVAGGLAGAAVGAVGRRLDTVGFLLLTAVLAVAAGAAVQALPDLTGAERGLGPLLGLGVPIGGSSFAALSSLGDLHLAAVVTVVVVAGCALLDTSRIGAGWRATGSDPVRAARTGIRTGVAAGAVLALTGAVCAFAGALTAHVAGVASPATFAVDAAAFPLLAALATGNRPIPAAALAAAISALGAAVLPDVGWQGPPSAPALSLALLAVITAATLLRRRTHPAAATTAPGADAPWPFARRFDGIALDVPPTRASAPGGSLILDAPAVAIPAGTVSALVGANGAGKSTLLQAIDTGQRARGVVLLPQDGGGFASCTVAETLLLAARAGAAPDPVAVAAAWLDRLQLRPVGDRRCGTLSDGQRRLVDLARALLTRPRALLCDEPLAGLDAAQRDAVIACLRAAAGAGLTLLVADHDREALRSLTGAVTELQRPAGDTTAASLHPEPV